MDNFEVPAIPKIFVPQSIPQNQSSNPSKSILKSSKREDLVKKNDSNSSEPEITEGTKKDAAPPQLCASCSQILLSYFMPLQQYVNEVVQMAQGDRVVTPLPLFNLLNSQVLKSENSFSEQRSHFEDKAFTPSEREVCDQTHTESQQSENKRTTSHDSRDESNRHQNQNSPQNQNYNQNQNQNFNPNQSNRNTENYNQNVNQNYNQTNISSNYSQREDQNIEQQRTENWESRAESSGQTQQTDNRQESNTHNISGDNHFERSYQQNSDSNRSDDNYKTPSEQRREDIYPEANGSTETEEQNAVAISSPFAFVTIAYNNLSATNAIILANSLLLTNNKSMNIIDKNGNKSTIQIPFIILIGGNIDPVLKDAIYMIFDEVISQPMDVKVALLSDQSFGIQQFKLQLWKELQNYQKVVGRVTNLFEECQELSACIDWLFPDNFNCSVFVFEPSLTTYEQIISFAIFHQKCSAQKDEGVGETLDEMTLLNQFFAPKWNRISFVYNFVKNDAIYTQIPAFMKYGDSIRIVNFGHMMSQTGMTSNQPGMSSVQPWHILFDLLTCSQQDVIKGMPLDNYSKFYLNCFIQRLWPILQNHLTPLLVSKYGVGRREWSIFDLIRLLTNESGIETDDHMFTQTPITFRRIKSPAEKISKYETLSIDDEDDYLSEQMPILAIDDQNVETQNDYQQNPSLEFEGKTNETEGEQSQPPQPQLSAQQEDERSKREWEAGRIDWMGAHQSDRIINRLKKLIRND